jgi:hypothetical protein
MAKHRDLLKIMLMAAQHYFKLAHATTLLLEKIALSLLHKCSVELIHANVCQCQMSCNKTA